MTRAPRYDAHTKAVVVARAVEVGPAEAAREHGIKPTTVRSWCSRAGVATVATERTHAATEANQARWEQRRSALVHRIGAVAEKALDVVEIALDNGETRKASDASATLARLVDKAQLLSGGSTARMGTDADREAVVADARTQALRLVSDAG